MRLQTCGTVVVGIVACGCWPGSSRNGLDVLEVGSKDIQAVTSEARFVSVRDMVLDSGVVWVLDGAPPFLSRVPLAEGRTLQFGVEGQGPGEFLNPWAIQPEPGPGGPGIRVWDLGTHRVALLDAAGGLQASESLSEEGVIRARSDIRSVSYADPFRVRSEGTTTLVGDFPRRVDRTGDMAAGSLRRADHRLGAGPFLVHFADHVEGGTPSHLEWAGVPLWDLCEGAVALWSPSSAQVIWPLQCGSARGVQGGGGQGSGGPRSSPGSGRRNVRIRRIPGLPPDGRGCVARPGRRTGNGGCRDPGSVLGDVL